VLTNFSAFLYDILHMKPVNLVQRHGHLRKAGFGLIELLIALVIIGILAAVAVPAYNRKVAEARQADAQRQLMVIAQAQETFRFLNGVYATDAQRVAALGPYGWMENSGPYGFSITATGVDGAGMPTFTAQAQGDIDGDDTLDTWTIDQNGNLVNTINDVNS